MLLVSSYLVSTVFTSFTKNHSVLALAPPITEADKETKAIVKDKQWSFFLLNKVSSASYRSSHFQFRFRSLLQDVVLYQMKLMMFVCTFMI